MNADRYKGDMPDSWFRSLSPREEAKFRKWARDNWSAALPGNFAAFHPVVRDEWRKIDKEQTDV
jgi:hypothetical protein